MLKREAVSQIMLSRKKFRVVRDRNDLLGEVSEVIVNKPSFVSDRTKQAKDGDFSKICEEAQKCFSKYAVKLIK